MDTIMIIYKTTNIINGKIYIGKDKHNNPKYLGSGKLLNYAIKKYGKCNFIKDILEICNSEEELNIREIFWIEKYNSLNRKIGYNIANGGTGGNTRKGYSESELGYYKQKLSNSITKSLTYKKSIMNRRGIKRPEHSKKMKELYATGQLIPHNLGKVTNDVTRKKISTANIGKKLTDDHKNKIAFSKHKPIDQFDINDNYITTYYSIQQASIENGIGRDSIYGCCIGKYKQGGGYKWKYNKNN